MPMKIVGCVEISQNVEIGSVSMLWIFMWIMCIKFAGLGISLIKN
jgi:hypothetical protein